MAAFDCLRSYPSKIAKLICLHFRYKHYKDQVEKTKSVNRSAELEFVAEVNDIKPGTEWERVNKLVDFNAKHAKSTKDTTRYISLLKLVVENENPVNGLLKGIYEGQDTSDLILDNIGFFLRNRPPKKLELLSTKVNAKTPPQGAVSSL